MMSGSGNNTQRTETRAAPRSSPDSPGEINNRLRRRYLDRLKQRVRKLRKLLVERNWEELRGECSQLALSGENFGFDHLTQLAQEVQNSIPSGKVARAATPIHAKENAEALIGAIDGILFEYSVTRE